MKVLIMAGGSGERFWPLSTKERPKQLLSIVTGKSMIRETVERILKISKPEDIYIATNEMQSSSIIMELNEIPISNIIIEPAFKDTASAIAYGSTIINRDSPNPTIVVIASDHLIDNENDFFEMINLAIKEAEKNSIITLGVKPNRPETGYGYIKIQENIIGMPTKVLRFMEKPNLLTAEQYIEEGTYLWNSGMFIFKYDTFINELKKHVPNHYKVLQDIKNTICDYTGIKLANETKVFFEKFEKISIDFALMEKSNIITCIPVDFGWNDVGGFKSLDDIFPKDINGNISKECRYVYVDSHNNIVISNRKERLITTYGVNDMIIVDTEEALLICNKSSSEKIKDLLKIIY